MRIQRLRTRTRIIVFFVALLALVQLAGFALVNDANSRNAHAKVEEEFDVGERLFARVLSQNSEKLTQAARVLAADFAFREAVATRDLGTIGSALSNHGARIGAGAMLFVALDGAVIADTVQPTNVPRTFEYAELLKADSATGPAHGAIKQLAGRPFQLVAVPVRAPLTIGWVVVGLPVDNGFALELQKLTSLGVSFMLQDRADGWHTLATTLSNPESHEVVAQMPPDFADTTVPKLVKIASADYQVRAIPLSIEHHRRIVAVLHRSLTHALAAFDRLRQTLIALAIASRVF